MTTLVVKPAGALEGDVQALGAKNAVLKEMAACLLASGEHHLTNVPNITDVGMMAELLGALGCTVARPADHELSIVVPEASDINPVAPARLFEAMRASIVILGPLLARCGRADMALPGGDDFGQRPINFHTDGLSAMGATFHNDRTFIRATIDRPRLSAARITLEYPSHTATDNLLMACVLAEGRSVIDNAAREPEVEDLGHQLIAMGARIEGLGTSRLTIDGVDELRPARHDVVTDRVVSATYLAAGLITGGEVRVVDAHPEHMEMLLRKIEAMGGVVDVRGPGVAAQGPRVLRACDVATLPYPGVATDYKPLITTMLSVADGVSVVTENLFVGRFRYVDELVRLGASITTEGHHAMIRGVDHLTGTSVHASDIRAAAALILAGLVADGETTVTGLEHMDRGYDDFVGRLAHLGANIERFSLISSDPAELVEQARSGSRTALARLLTFVESGGANQLATAALAYRASAPYVVGVTGPPGAGKSTLTDQLINVVLERGSFGGTDEFDQVSVLCVDPSSPFTGGAILGDRIRMQGHATNEHVFIRSMATRGHLGGLSLAVPDAVRVLGAATFRLVLVETVGVGQMEVEIASAADTTIVVVNPGWGDAMQANKAGLLEVADIFVINKADRAGVRETRRDLDQMLDLGGAHEWRPPILETVATDGAGVPELWDAVVEHRTFIERGPMEQRRRARMRVELDKVLSAMVRSRIGALAHGDAYEEQIAALLAGATDPYSAAETLLADA